MIPRIIHCCWFGGGPKPALVRRCLASWKKFAPGFEIREWTVPMLRAEFGALPPFAEAALASRKWAFASDWARFAVVSRFGGVYLDTDVELVKPIDGLVERGEAFFALNDDARGWVDPGVGFAAPSGEPSVAEMARRYETMVFDPACHQSQVCPVVANAVLADFRRAGRPVPRLLPARCFDPKGGCAGEVKLTDDTYAIHHYAASWFNWRQRLVYKVLPRLGLDVGPLFRWLRGNRR